MKVREKKKKKLFKVETKTELQGWVDCWLVTDANGKEVPERFTSRKAAQAEIDDLVSECQARGMSVSEYRIVPA